MGSSPSRRWKTPSQTQGGSTCQPNQATTYRQPLTHQISPLKLVIGLPYTVRKTTWLWKLENCWGQTTLDQAKRPAKIQVATLSRATMAEWWARVKPVKKLVTELRASLANPKILYRIESWDVRTMNWIGKIAQVTDDQRWNDIGSISLKLVSAGRLGSADSDLRDHPLLKWGSNLDNQACQRMSGELVNCQRPYHHS